MNRILTIQDISCIGKCSLTVALPIISSFGIETAVLPTAVLSTHTAFNEFTFRDLTDDLENITEVWKKENIQFKSIYTGYLGSIKQIDIVSNIFDKFKTKETLLIVDPAMADNGKLYTGFDMDFCKKMAELCSKADIIVPNLTEACFMLDIPYVKENYTEDYIKDILVKLTDLGCKTAVLTGISFSDDKLGTYAYNSQTKEFFCYYNTKMPSSFHGTGDIFASTLCGCLGKNFTLDKALKIAVDFTLKCISCTVENPNHNWYGVDFENALPYLIDIVK